MDKDKRPQPEKAMQIVPLSMKEIEEAAQKRVSLINREFRAGFEFLKKYPQSVSFFGSARFDDDNPYYRQARSLAKRIVEETGYAIVTGGGPGIMEAGNRGADDVNGTSLGITIELPHEQTTNKFVHQSKGFHYFFSRKVILTYAAEAYVFFPGGFGTLDELFEIITLVQTKKITPVPIILAGSDYWNPFKDLLEKELLARHTIDKDDLNLFVITDDEEEIIDMIKNAPVRNGDRYDHDEDQGQVLLDSSLAGETCQPCEGDVPPMTGPEIEPYLQKINGWSLIDGTRIEKTVDTKDFTGALDAMEEIGALAEQVGHHPDICIHNYQKVTISLSTHAIGGLSKNDFILAAKIDSILDK